MFETDKAQPCRRRRRSDAMRRSQLQRADRLDADMDELDFSADIAALRSTFADIRSVIGVERLQADIASLSEQAGAPELWDDTDNAQKITSALSHRQSELARIDSIQLRLDDLEVMVE